MFLQKMIAPALMLAAFVGSPIQAQDFVMVASTCTVDEAATGKFEMNFGRFQFDGNYTGTIDARCNVSNPLDSVLQSVSWNAMEVSYDDPDGALAGTEVVVTLRRVDKYTGGSTLIATLSSNNFGPGQQLRNVPISHSFNFVNYAYYIGISVKRTTSMPNPGIQRVRLRTVVG